jgi:hypothetical protein
MTTKHVRQGELCGVESSAICSVRVAGVCEWRLIVRRDEVIFQCLFIELDYSHTFKRLKRYCAIPITRGNEIDMSCVKELDSQTYSLFGVDGNAEN